MKVLIIEDEILIAQKLSSLLSEAEPNAEILANLQSVAESVEWLENNPMPDLIFMDIHLADTLSFAIFERVEVTCPIIFTTAYDEYALKAFEVNSVDYILKPVSRQSLQKALDKFHRFGGAGKDNSTQLKQLAELLRQSDNRYSSSVLIAQKDKLIPLKVDDIAYIYYADKEVTFTKLDGSKQSASMSLDDIAQKLNPAHFYRANRQFIIAKKAVKDITTWFSHRVVVNLTVDTPEKIVVSRTNVQEIKRWLTE